MVVITCSSTVCSTSIAADRTAAWLFTQLHLCHLRGFVCFCPLGLKIGSIYPQSLLFTFFQQHFLHFIFQLPRSISICWASTFPRSYHSFINWRTGFALEMAQNRCRCVSVHIYERRSIYGAAASNPISIIINIFTSDSGKPTSSSQSWDVDGFRWAASVSICCGPHGVYILRRRTKDKG